jgi:signal transduction histidine kinase
LVLVVVTLLSSCGSELDAAKPSIKFVTVPRADKGGVIEQDVISGTVSGARSGQRVVLFARSGAWYVQPWADQPFTDVQPDSTWSNSTHLGTEYAALLVDAGYIPQAMTYVLPVEGGGVVAVASVEGTPPFWRTRWFMFLLVLVWLLGLFALYRWRLHDVRTKLQLRFEERLAERTRIAQDLHDTLLQGLVSASMQLHVANERLEPDSPAKPVVGRVMELLGQVIEEGRDAVRGLRSSTQNGDNLETAFVEVGKQLATDDSKNYRVIVEGTQRQLRPIIRDEVYRIGREALSNAFRHSQASKIEVELEYSTKQLRVLVRDDGMGIDQNVLHDGKDGHWGLKGMRERAESIGARFRVYSRARAGTEVELLIPGGIAFASTSSDQSKSWLQRFRRRDTPDAPETQKGTE